MKITSKHRHMAGICRRGMQAFYKRHGLDWSEFLKNGTDEQVLLDTGDAMAKYLVEVAHGRK